MTQAADDDSELTSRPVYVRDVEALIGWLAVVEGEVWGGAGPERLIARLRQRFERVGLLSESDDERAFRQAVSDMNQRLRFALGEYADPPAPVPVGE
ncbi:MAG: hypothetical protein REI45_13550 [Propionicimonas sp.]|nr:hypothetical protein [Propionicimonas sp.]